MRLRRSRAIKADVLERAKVSIGRRGIVMNSWRWCIAGHIVRNEGVDVKAEGRKERARLTFEGDIILMVRPSGNAPEMRAYVEVANARAAEDFLQNILERLAAKAQALAAEA